MAEEQQERKSSRSKTSSWKRKEEEDRVNESNESKRQKQTSQNEREVTGRKRKAGAEQRSPKHSPKKTAASGRAKNTAKRSPERKESSESKESSDSEPENFEDSDRAALPTLDEAKKELQDLIDTQDTTTLRSLAEQKLCPLPVRSVDGETVRLTLKRLNEKYVRIHKQLKESGMQVSGMQQAVYVTQEEGLYLVGADKEVADWRALSLEQLAGIQVFIGNFPTVLATQTSDYAFIGSEGVKTIQARISLVPERGTLFMDRVPCTVEGDDRQDYTVPPAGLFNAFQEPLEEAINALVQAGLTVFTAVSGTVGAIIKDIINAGSGAADDDILLYRRGNSQAWRLAAGVVMAWAHTHISSSLYKGIKQMVRVRLITSMGGLFQLLGRSRPVPFDPDLAALRDATLAIKFRNMDKTASHDWGKYWWGEYYEMMLVRTRGDVEEAIKLVKLKLGEGSYASVKHWDGVVCSLETKVYSLTVLERLARESSLCQLAVAYTRRKQRVELEKKRAQADLKRHQSRLQKRVKSGQESGSYGEEHARRIEKEAKREAQSRLATLPADATPEEHAAAAAIPAPIQALIQKHKTAGKGKSDRARERLTTSTLPLQQFLLGKMVGTEWAEVARFPAEVGKNGGVDVVLVPPRLVPGASKKQPCCRLKKYLCDDTVQTILDRMTLRDADADNMKDGNGTQTNFEVDGIKHWLWRL